MRKFEPPFSQDSRRAMESHLTLLGWRPGNSREILPKGIVKGTHYIVVLFGAIDEGDVTQYQETTKTLPAFYCGGTWGNLPNRDLYKIITFMRGKKYEGFE